MKVLNLYGDPRPPLYDKSDGRSLGAVARKSITEIAPSVWPEKRLWNICRELALPNRNKIESIALLIWAIVSVVAIVFCFGELFQLLSSGALEQTVRAALAK